MKNLLEETFEGIRNFSREELENLDNSIIWAVVSHEGWNNNKSNVGRFILKSDRTFEDFENFLHNLDFDYENEHKEGDFPEVFGIITFVDKTWKKREEDGNFEWWSTIEFPQEPNWEELENEEDI